MFKGDRKIHQQFRIARMAAIAMYLNLYFNRKIHAISYNSEIDYEKIEDDAVALSEVFGMEIPAEALYNEREVDEQQIFAITDNIKTLSESMKHLFLDEGDLIAMSEQLFHNPNWVISQNIQNFTNQMKILLLFQTKQIKECNLIDVNMFPPHHTQFSPFRFRRTWREIEREYKEVMGKRLIRKYRKLNR